MARKIFESIEDIPKGVEERLRNRIALLLLDGLIEMVRGRRYSDALAKALDDKRDEVMDVVIDAVKEEKVNELIEYIMVDVLKEIRKEIEESS